MIQGFKNKISLKVFLNAIFLFTFILFGTFFLPQSAYAILGIFGGVADAIGKAIGWMFVSFALAIPTAILGIASIFLGWSIDPFFIRVPYTSGGVVDIGWPVVRDLANMGIVLAFVAIGLATALRIQEYQARKTLPLLIAVALLINFTPVILGVIVDAANIVMNFFLEGLTGGQILGTIFSNISAIIAGDLGGFNFFNPIELLSFVFKIVIIGWFMMFAALVFFLFAILFIMRRVVIWLLVILSPLAFVAYILPATRSFARMWWNQFVQWTIIGVFAAFFLWLGDQMIGLAAQGGLTGDVPSSGPGGLGVAGIFNDVAPYGIALIFLLLGFFVALSTSAMGAGGIIASTQAGGKWAAKAAGRVGVDTARGGPAVSQAEARIRQRLEQTPVLSGLVGGPGAYARSINEDRRRAGRNLEQMPTAQIRQVMERRPVTREENLRRARAFEILAERNQIGEQDRPYEQGAFQYGVSPGLIHAKIPRWSPTAAGIQEHVERQTPTEFRQNIHPHAFEIPPPPGAPPGTPPTYTPENLAVFYAMDFRKATELGLRGNRIQKEALRNLTDQMEPAITAEIAALRAAGPGTPQWRQADKIEDMWIYIQNNPNYQA